MVNSRHIWNLIALNECRCCTQLNATQRDSRVFIPSKRHVYTCFEFCWKYKTLFVYTQDIEHHSLGRWFIFAMNQGERGAHHSRNDNGLLSCTVPTAQGLNRNKWWWWWWWWCNPNSQVFVIQFKASHCFQPPRQPHHYRFSAGPAGRITTISSTPSPSQRYIPNEWRIKPKWYINVYIIWNKTQTVHSHLIENPPILSLEGGFNIQTNETVICPLFASSRIYIYNYIMFYLDL